MLGMIFIFVPLPANIIALLVLSVRKRWWLVWGVVLAIMVNSIGTILTGVNYSDFTDIFFLYPFFLWYII